MLSNEVEMVVLDLSEPILYLCKVRLAMLSMWVQTSLEPERWVINRNFSVIQNAQMDEFDFK